MAASTVLLTAALHEETDSFDGRNTDVAEGSQNLNFGYLISGVPAVAVPPSVTAFDPNQGGYSFLFRAKDFGSVGIIVNVGEVSPVPLPAGLPRLALGLGALGIMRARRTA